MRVLVTGGAGFIGSHTVDQLIAKGHEVRILDSLQPRVHPKGKPSWISTKAEFIKGDVSDPNDLGKALQGMDAVFHLAAYQDYIPEFSKFIHTNTESAALIFELIVAKHLPIKKIVFASSQSVCGEGKYICKEHGLIVPLPRPIKQLEAGDWEIHCPHCDRYMEPILIDEATVSPGTTYGISKYAIELLADRLGRRYDIPTVCMRYTYVQGTRNSFYNAYSGIARRFAMRILHDLPPTIYEDGKQRRDYLNVKDVAKANVLVMEKDDANFKVFNVGGGQAITVSEFADKMLKALHSNLPATINGDFRVGDTRHTVSDISRMQALGWQPTISIDETIEEYVGWIKEQSHTAEFLEEAERTMKELGVVRPVKRQA